MKILKLLISLSLIFISGITFSQDLIKLKNGKTIKARLVEVLEEDIKYKKYSKFDERFHTITKESVFSINYENGNHLIFEEPEEIEQPIPRYSKDIEQLSMTSLGFFHVYREGEKTISKSAFYQRLNSLPEASKENVKGSCMHFYILHFAV